MANLNIRVDDRLKRDVESILFNLGLTTSDAVRIYFNQIRNNSGIPFDLVLHRPTALAAKAMEETLGDMANKTGSKPYADSDKLMNDLLGD
jgi:DNA-damage-inducible protein J